MTFDSFSRSAIVVPVFAAMIAAGCSFLQTSAEVTPVD